MARFSYAPEIGEAFPAIRGGVIHATGLANSDAPESLIDTYRAEQVRVRSHIGDHPLSGIPSLAAWRRAFSSFGVKPTQYRSAAEALLRRLTKQGDIPSINLLVDVANLVSIRYQLPVAVFDQASMVGGTTVKFAEGTEEFTDLGSDSVSHPQPGEVVFVDEAGVVSARRWCWRQSNQSAAGPTTTEAIITVEGLHEEAETDVASAGADMMGLLDEYQPEAQTALGLLSPLAPVFTA